MVFLRVREYYYCYHCRVPGATNTNDRTFSQVLTVSPQYHICMHISTPIWYEVTTCQYIQIGSKPTAKLSRRNDSLKWKVTCKAALPVTERQWNTRRRKMRPVLKQLLPYCYAVQVLWPFLHLTMTFNAALMDHILPFIDHFSTTHFPGPRGKHFH